MTDAQLDVYCRIVARGDFAAADIFMQQCLAACGVSPSGQQPKPASDADGK